MGKELEAARRPRPVRVAFLIEEGEHSHLALDGIFADSFRRWGGRFSLIIPCVAGRISPAYWPWLETYDPDIVYAYVELTEADVLEIHERLNPSECKTHRHHGEPRLDVHGFKPSYSAEILSSLSTIFRSARHRSSRNGIATEIIDAWNTDPSTRFLTDNFGTYHGSFGTGVFPPDARNSASLLTIVSADRAEDRRYAVPRDLNAVGSELEAMRAFAERRATSLSVSSILFSSKLEISKRSYSGSFNLVVGDSYEDRILLWNARHFIPAWLDDDLQCLRVTRDQLDDDAFLDCLKELLNRRNYVNDGSGGQSALTIRSCSLNAEELEVFRQKLTAAKVWSFARVEVVTSLDDLVPSARELKHVKEGNRFGGGFFNRPDWDRFTWTGPAVKPQPIGPDHLSDAPPRQTFTLGIWATDYLLGNEQPGARMSNSNMWELPGRWRMAGAFTVEFASSPPHPLPGQRRSRNGRLTIFENTDYPVASITIPTPLGAFRYALALDGQWAEGLRQRGIFSLPSKVAWLQPSNEARYFDGVLGIGGGLLRASQFLLHPFLRSIFSTLGGSPSIGVDKIKPTLDSIVKLRKTRPAFDLRDERERITLAKLIIAASRHLKNPQSHVRYDYLKSEWAEYRRVFWAAQQHQPETDDGVNWDDAEEKSLESCLIELRRCEILFQGHRWTCPNCHHRNWVDLAEIKPELSCSICRNASDAPIAVDWLFRANEFVIESLRDHSVLSLLWVLSVLRNRAHSSLVYVAPTSIFYDRDHQEADAEIDLLAIVDGKAVICEVKSSWSGLRQSDISNFVALAKKLRPDRAIIAIMEAGRGFVAEIEAATIELAGLGIALEVLSDDDRPDDNPYLSYDASTG